ncbi:MAG: UDP-N-acetylmuramoyl-L-alanyl-D-glutamate--2,6-diaminopimelate ligase [Ruminococcus sp.]|nr:UDP-N-acetylmuramoyl-L-alanyl-D-glutamate--2,6-diaminopimelate ligase [Ruminococcus sp.]
MKLNELIENHGISDREITSITDDTRKVEKGSLFFCVKGAKFDGHTSATEMLEKGAAAVVCEHDLGLGDNQIITENSRKLYGEVCSAWFGHPEKKLKMIGVTGTNGKTTTTNIIKHILMQSGHKTGLVGTIQNEIGDEIFHTDNTTPFAYDFMALLDRMVKAGCEYVVMEVSSFGLVQNRIGSSHFDVALFTNLTQDHLDYHKDMEDYYQAKKLLFDMCDTAICNIDDAYGDRLYDEISCHKLSLSVKERAYFWADDISIKANGSEFYLNCYDGKEYHVKTNMTGMFNISNVLSAIAVCMEEHIPVNDILSAVGNYSGVKGRCEIIPTGRDFTVICDYAHTPDAVENVLKSLKPYAENRLICLFGCGGNRDSAKRPKMARSAEKYADKLIITSDNPRDEKPEEIINEILSGLVGGVPYDVVTDRREAIYHALKTAEKGDIIVLAGKGHEDYQILENNRHIHFDEREVVADGLKLI